MYRGSVAIFIKHAVHGMVTGAAPGGGEDVVREVRAAGADGEDQAPVVMGGHEKVEVDALRQPALGIFSGWFSF